MERIDGTVIDFFTHQAQQAPVKTAVIEGEQSLSYQQLEDLSNVVAAYLLTLDLPKGSIIPLLFDRSIDYMAILLGTLKAGLAFLPLDPDIPQERLAHILLETQSTYLVTNRDIKNYANWHHLSVLASQDLLQQRSLQYQSRAVLPTDLAYVIYTSGSTGAPKGVMIEHQALAHFTQAALKAYAIRREDRVLQFAAYSFDTSLEEIVLSLAAGATLCLRSHEMIDSTQHFLTACDALDITVLDLPTAFWHRLTYDMVHYRLPFPHCISTVIIGGEAAQTEAIRQWCAYVDPRVRLINTYGPTETTIAVTACELTCYPELSTQHNLIGQPLGDAQLYILDQQQRLLPLGVTGDLWVGGPCLARGYLQQDELTREHFISINELRLYRTGDRAQWITPDLLAFKGRQDRQVKLRGYRIELEEIEKVLQAHPQVKQCVVLYAEEDNNGFIAAFIIPVNQTSVNTSQIYDYLRAYLPSYMLPSQWKVLDSLPMTRHSKIDAAALLDLLKTKESLTQPQTTVEEKLANIWRELLHVSTVTTTSHFFEMGGHSLLAMRLVGRIHAELNAPVTLRDVLENPNFAEMLVRVNEKAKSGFSTPALLKKVDREKRLPLSFGQEALWIFDQLQAGQSIAYNIAYAIHLTGQLNRKALEQALDYILQRHEILRTLFKTQEGVVHQSVLEQHFHLNVEKITRGEWGTIALTEARTSFDLANAPPLRIRLFEFSPNHHRLLIHHHHIIHDGYSIQLHKKELRHCYAAFCSNEAPHLPPLPLQYADYAFHQRAQTIDSTSLAYWREKLHQVKPLILPLRKPRSKMTTQAGSHHVFTLDAKIIHTLRTFCHQHDCTLFAGVLAAFVILFSRYSGETDITVGTMTSLRDNSAIEPLIGFFLNAVLLRNQVNNAADFLTLLQQVKKTLLEASTYRFVPLDHLAQALKLPRIDNSPALFDVMIAFHHFEQALTQFDLAGFTSEIEFIQNDTAKYGLAVDIFEQGQTLLCDIEYSTELYSPQSMALLAEHYTHLLQAITQNFNQPVSTYCFLTEKERTAYLQGVFPWRFDAECTANDLFNAVVLNNPTVVAIQHQQVSLSYSALQHAVDQLARVIYQQATLSGYPLKPDMLIAVYLDRSPAMLIAILAILKVGAAFVPLDPNYPEKRVQFILADAEIKIIITQSHYWQRLHAFDPSKILIDADALTFNQDLTPLPPLTYRPDDLAYVIYTSGTTGQPKGVMIEHRQVCHYIQWFAQLLPVADIDRVDFSTNIIFDASITNTLLSLCLGKTVVICDESIKTSPKDYLQYLARERINLVKMTPSYFNLLTKITPTIALPDLRHILVGGEAIQAVDLQKWLTVYPQHLIYNSYGPTETTVTVSKFKIDAGNVHSIPVNAPIEENSRIGPFYILDAHHHLVPDYVLGELYLGGPTLARGYLKREDLTHKAFCYPDLGMNLSQRLYQTGDLCVRREGVIYYLGRIDSQIKLRGYRIELEEISATLNQHPFVATSTVLCHTEEGEPTLVAYCVLSPSVDERQAMVLTALRTYLNGVLPAYMIPHHFLILNTMPLTTTGKIDRQALPDWRQVLIHTALAKPNNPIESQLQAIWQSVLKQEAIPTTAPFFEVGGHSLAAIQICYAISQAFKFDLALSEFFANNTIEKLALLLQSKTQDHFIWPQAQEDVAHAHEPFSLTEVQQGYWLGRNATFSLNVATHLYTEYDFHHLDIERLQLAFNRVLERHGMLRAIVTEAGMQKILPFSPYTLVSQDLRQLSASQQRSRLQAWRQAMSHQVFDTSQWPLFDVRVSITSKRYRLHLSFDGILFDGLSLELFRDDLTQYYRDPTVFLPTLNLTFRDYMLAYQTLKDTPRYERDRRYWLNKIPTFPLAPELPFLENPAGAVQPRFERKIATIEKRVWQQFKEQAQRYDLSPTSVLLAIYGQVLARWSKSSHFLINLTLFNRFPLHPQVNSILGDFTILELFEFGTEPAASGDNSLLSFLTHIQKNLWDDLDHRFFTGIHVLRELAQTRRIPPDNIAPVVFTCLLHLDTPASASQPFLSAEESMGLAYEITQTSQVWLDNKVFELNGELVAEWDYLAALFPEGVIEAMHVAFCDLIRYLATTDWEQQPFPDCLPAVVTDVVCAMNQTATLDAPCFLDEDFHHSAKHLPDKTAIIFRQQSINYANLSAQVDQVIQRIQACTEYAAAEVIAVYMQKTVYQAIACLAILKLGKAYLPVHAEWPVERVKAILTDTPVRIVLAHQPLLETLDTRLQQSKIFIALDKIETKPRASKKIPLKKIPKRHSNDPAYIIYTSGSTGKPKGVRNSHGAASNTVQDINRRFQVSAQDTLLALADISFDLSVYDMFGLLGVGGTIVLPEQALLKEPAHWLSLMKQHSVTIWNSVPALMQMLVDYVELLSAEEKAQYAFSLRLILLSGDVIPVPLPARIQRIFPNAQIISVGGPTECSIWSVVYPIQQIKVDWKRIPYGKPLSNQTIYVLNAAYQYTPFYVCGDIYIGGRGLAIDYWQDPAKTQEKFINHPQTGERLYKTGDLGSLLPNGEMMILGRDDFQIKKDGHRIELGEIAAHIRQFPFIRDVVVDVCPHLTHQKALVAFIVRKKVAATMSQALLRYEQTNIRTQQLSSFEVILTSSLRDKRFYYVRKSYRDFNQKHNSRITLSLLTQCLSLTDRQTPPGFTNLNELLLPLSTDGNVNLPKYRYPSAGGLYPVQVYVTVTEICDDVPVGHYYYHPYYHKLIQITAEKAPSNAGVTLHFVTHLPAIAPLYADHALPFSQLEVGYMLGLLPGGDGPIYRDPQIHAALKLTPEDQYIVSYPCTRTSRLAPPKDSLRLYLLYPDGEAGTLTAYRWCWQQQQLKDKQVFNGNLVAHVSMDHSMSILDEAACLLCFVGHATVENDLAIGSRAQEMMLSLLEQQIGACPLGSINLSPAVFDYVLSDYLGGKLLHTVACGAVSDQQIADTRPSLAKESDPSYLRHALSKVLPSVMLPDYFVDVDQIPLTLNGKVDRKALHALLSATTAQPKDYQEPSTPNEKIMADIWQEVLKQERIGLTDNFFSLGGSSLTAVQVISRINTIYQQNVMVRDIFVAPTIQALLAHLKLAEPPEMGSLIPILEQQETALASYAQQRLWFLSHYDAKQSLSYHIPMGYRIKGALDVNALEKSINCLIERHSSLRTSFKQQHQVYQVVQPFRYQKLVIETIMDEFALTQKIHILLAKNFNLERGLLFEVYLFRLMYSAEHLLWINQHHSISDGWSLMILRSELSDLYNRFHAQQSPQLTLLQRSYIDYSHWQRETYLTDEKIAEQKRYWLKQLQTIPSLDLTIAKPRPLVQTFNGAVHRFEISPALTAQLKQCCLTEDITFFMLLLSAYALTLQRYSDVDTVIIGTPVANRRHPDLEGMVGFFVNILPLCIFLGDNPSLRRCWERVKNICLDAFHHQDIPFAMLVESLQLERDISRTPVFQTTFVLQPQPEKTLELTGLEVVDFKIKTGLAKFDLHLEIIESSSHGLSCALEFNTDIFAALDIQRFAEHYCHLLESLLQDTHKPIQELPLLTAAEKNLLTQWNDTREVYPKDTVYMLFKQQAQRYPDYMAIVGCEQRLTYQELDRLSTELAHHLPLEDAPVNPIVALLMDRSVEAIVAILAIHQCGAAYLPLDTSSPLARLQNILVNAQPAVILTQKIYLPLLKDSRNKVVAIEDLLNLGAKSTAEKSSLRPTRDNNTASIIYTSGSTGVPKGVINTHLGLSNRIQWMQQQYRLSHQDKVLHKTPLTFDVSEWEIFWPLTQGACLIVAPPDTQFDAPYLAKLIQNTGVTVAHFVPSMLKAFMEVNRHETFPTLTKIICSGEALPYAVVEQFYEHYPQVELHNLYGPTEASIDVSHWYCERNAQQMVLIGAPIANMTFHVLNAYHQPVPVGLPGELWIGGVGLAAGYLNNAAQTEQAFMHLPHISHERLYHTGDRVQWRPNGQLHYLGRKDTQIKLRGYRIELSEIEAVLAMHAAVSRVVAVLHGEKEQQKLIAFVEVSHSFKDKNHTLLKQELVSLATQHLLSYMLPEIQIIERIPITTSGKADRQALAGYEVIRPSIADPGVPSNVLEETLIKIWKNLFHLKTIGTNDHFFHLGGHSLLALHCVAEIQTQLGISLPVMALFKYPVLKDLASNLSQNSPSYLETDTILLITTTGKNPPLFLVHPASGLSLHYLSMKEFMPDCPVYAINNPRFGHPENAFSSVEEMAACYVDMIQTRYPEGPLHLGGWSFGGVAAFEMAQQLVQRGREVVSVVLIDSYKLTERDAREVEEKAHRQLLEQMGLQPQAEFAEKIRFELEHNTQLIVNYTPKTYEGSVVLIKATQLPDSPLPIYQDPYNGWYSFVHPQNFKHTLVTKTHHALLTKDHVESVANIIAKYLSLNSNLTIG